MDENNFFESENTNGYDGEQAQGQMKPTKQKSKLPGIVLLAVGAVLMAAGAVVLVLGNRISSMEYAAPVDLYRASETDQYVYTLVQYMTEPVACYIDMESMQFYIAIDDEWYPTVVCIHDADMGEYQPYIDWFYSSAEENGPERKEILGYAQPMEDDLRELVIEGFAAIFGEEYVDESNFEEFFGEYYIQVGEKNGAYQFSNFGILFLVLGFVLLVIGGALLYQKTETQPQAQYGSYGSNPIVEETGNLWLGVLGAFLGALLGGLLWAVVNLMGFISGWIGILIIYFAYSGYKILSKREDKQGICISAVLGALMIFLATYLSWGFQYYQILNESISGYTTLARALEELPDYLESIDGWGNFIEELVMGYVFMLIASIWWLSARVRNKNKK